jgi:guanylate kinase
MQGILNKYPLKFNEIISCTTRPMREGEAHGVNYYFLTPDEFAEKILNEEMLEAVSFNGWCYGTCYDTLRSDCLNIGVFNPNGIRTFLAMKDMNVKVFRVKCSDKERLLRQLNRENNPNVDEIIRRFGADKNDFADLEFEYIEVKNETKEDFELAIEQIVSSLETSRG